VFQWKLVSSEPVLRPSKLGSNNEDNIGEGPETGQVGGEDFDAPGGGDEFTAVKPWYVRKYVELSSITHITLMV